MSDLDCKLLVIGAGPGGYVCAIRAGQLGINTIIVEEQHDGGTCLNVGCIPSKALIHAADTFHTINSSEIVGPLGITVAPPAIDLARTVEWKDGIVARLNRGVGSLLRKAKVKAVRGKARFRDGKSVTVETPDGEVLIRAENIVIATGSAPVELPSIPFGGDVLSSTEALSLAEVPRSLAVVGGGYIGLEIGTAFAKLGAKVVVIEADDRILPLYDEELTRPVAKRLDGLGVTVRTKTRAMGYSDGVLTLAGDGGGETVVAAKVLVCVGRRARTSSGGVDELSLAVEDACIKIDERCQTSMRGVYAIGDVTGEPMLAHRAMAQGEMVAEIVAGHDRSWDKVAIPSVCFTDPEIVTAGLSPDEAAKGGEEIIKAVFPFVANARAMTQQHDEGFVRVVASRASGVVLGVQAVGAHISELAGEFALALEMGARLDDLAATIHAHPTQGEAVPESALMALGHALHI